MVVIILKLSNVPDALLLTLGGVNRVPVGVGGRRSYHYSRKAELQSSLYCQTKPRSSRHILRQLLLVKAKLYPSTQEGSM